MNNLNNLWIIIASLTTNSPYNQPQHLDFLTANCGIGQQVKHTRFEQATPVATINQTMPETCSIGADNADTWMVVMLMAGGIILGVPATRRRNGRVVFS